MTHHDEALERVARAIAGARIEAFGSAAGVELREVEFDYARAAIEAISAGGGETREADIRADERKQALAIVERWMKPQSMKLHTGEMTAGELRTVLAVLAGLAGLAAAIRARGQS